MASFKKLKTGWQYRVSYYVEGKRKTKNGNGFRTKKEAEIAAREVESSMDHGLAVDKNPVFVDYMQDWYETYKKDKHSLRNNQVIEHAIKVAGKYFKQTKIKDITRKDYQKFINWYGQDHTTETVRKVHTYCKNCLREALNDRVIERDPTYRITPSGTKKAKSEQLKFLNEDEVKKLVTVLKDGINPQWESRYMALIAIATGMRFSEILALSWDDIDYSNSTITINKSFDHQNSQKIKETKTKSSVRTIVVDDSTLSLISQYKIAVQKQHPKYLFIDKLGHFPSNNACNKSLKRACKRAGIKEVTFHALRHTHCSLLIYKGFNIQYISKRMGHSNTSITYNVYGHVIDEMQQKENSKVGKVIESLFA